LTFVDEAEVAFKFEGAGGAPEGPVVVDAQLE
jgi:hypothetical protein